MMALAASSRVNQRSRALGASGNTGENRVQTPPFLFEKAIDRSGEHFQITVGGDRGRFVGLDDGALAVDHFHDIALALGRVSFLQVAIEVADFAPAEPITHVFANRDQFTFARVRHGRGGDARHFQRQHVGYFGFIGMIFVEGFLRVVLFEDVLCKCSFSARAVSFIEAKASFELAVSDIEQSALLVVVDIRPFAWTRHRFVISLISVIVVKSLFAIR
jgi:hypothetical protein